MPWAATDIWVAGWFHQRLTPAFISILGALSEPGSAGWVCVAVVSLIFCMAWKRSWRNIAALMLAVPCGALFGELLKLIVRRNRPYPVGPFGTWGGYSFPSGHTISATLLYGFLILLLVPKLDRRRWQALLILTATAIVSAVGFSRIALGAHYLSDVLGAMTVGSIWLLVSTLLLNRIRPIPVAATGPTQSVSPDSLLELAQPTG